MESGLPGVWVEAHSINIHGYFHSQKCSTRRDFSGFLIISHILYSTASLVESIWEEVFSKVFSKASRSTGHSRHWEWVESRANGCWAGLFYLFLAVGALDIGPEYIETSRCLARPLEVADTTFCFVSLIITPSYIGRHVSTEGLCLLDDLGGLGRDTVSAAVFQGLQ